jgi:hypothetical protein
MADRSAALDVEIVKDLIRRPDFDVLEAWVRSTDPEQLRAAAAWERSNPSFGVESDSEPWESRRAKLWVRRVLIAAGAPPGEAVRRLPWNDFWFVRESEGALLRLVVQQRTLDWANAFIPAAAQVKLGRRREPDTAPFLYSVLDPLIRAHGLQVPEGDAFLNGWARTELDDDPYLVPLYPALLRSSHLRHRPALPAALETAMAAEEIGRVDVVAAVLEALVSPPRPAAQRVLADVISCLDLQPNELRGRFPLLLNTLATAHGSVTAALLPSAVALAADAQDVEQLAAVIAGRSEKRQRATLLAHLEGSDLRDRVGTEGILDALVQFDVCDDAALLERVARHRTSLGRDVEGATVQPSPAPGGLWRPLVRRPERRPVALRVPLELDRMAVRLLTHSGSPDFDARRGRVNRVGDATLLESVVRLAGADPDSLRSALPAHDRPDWNGHQPVEGAIRCWLRGDLDHGPIYDPRIPAKFPNDIERRWQPRHRLINAAARESLWRCHRVSTVLSTPSLDDGTLELEALLHRVEAGLVPSFTPHDLAQALLRLRPISDLDRSRVDAIGDLELPADPECWEEHVDRNGRGDIDPPDGLTLITEWVHQGGLRPLDAEWIVASPRSWEWVGAPPLPAGVFDRLLVDVGALRDLSSTLAAVTLAPWWADLAAASLGLDRPTELQPDVALDSPGPAGTPTHAAVLAPLGGDPEVQRRGVVGLLDLAQRGSLSIEHARIAAETLRLGGMLPLSRLSKGLEQAFEAGGLADLWPVAVGVAADAAQHRPLPSGLPDILRLLAAYLPEVPDRELPVEITALATAKGSTKSHAEARALVAATRPS